MAQKRQRRKREEITKAEMLERFTAKRGSLAECARALNVSHVAIHGWLRNRIVSAPLDAAMQEWVRNYDWRAK